MKQKPSERVMEELAALDEVLEKNHLAEAPAADIEAVLARCQTLLTRNKREGTLHRQIQRRKAAAHLALAVQGVETEKNFEAAMAAAMNISRWNDRNGALIALRDAADADIELARAAYPAEYKQRAMWHDAEGSYSMCAARPKCPASLRTRALHMEVRVATELLGDERVDYKPTAAERLWPRVAELAEKLGVTLEDDHEMTVTWGFFLLRCHMEDAWQERTCRCLVALEKHHDRLRPDEKRRQAQVWELAGGLHSRLGQMTGMAWKNRLHHLREAAACHLKAADCFMPDSLERSRCLLEAMMEESRTSEILGNTGRDALAATGRAIRHGQAAAPALGRVLNESRHDFRTQVLAAWVPWHKTLVQALALRQTQTPGRQHAVELLTETTRQKNALLVDSLFPRGCKLSDCPEYLLHAWDKASREFWKQRSQWIDLACSFQGLKEREKFIKRHCPPELKELDPYDARTEIAKKLSVSVDEAEARLLQAQEEMELNAQATLPPRNDAAEEDILRPEPAVVETFLERLWQKGQENAKTAGQRTLWVDLCDIAKDAIIAVIIPAWMKGSLFTVELRADVRQLRWELAPDRDWDMAPRPLPHWPGEAPPPPETDIDICNKLLRPVLNPIRDCLTQKGLRPTEVIFCPDKSLLQVPLHAGLWEGDETWIDQFPISYLPSLRLADRNTAKTAPDVGSMAPPRACVVGNPARTLPYLWRNLPQAAKEAGTAAALLRVRGFEVTHLAGRDAVGERVSRALEGTDVVHLAAHYEFANAAHRRGFVLADRLLSGQELRKLARPGPSCVVIATACDEDTEHTGRFEDEPRSLIQDLLSAGVSSVVSARGCHHDVSSQVFVEVFYKAWLEHGLPLNAAVRLAILEVKRTHPKKKAWARFSLSGEHDRRACPAL